MHLGWYVCMNSTFSIYSCITRLCAWSWATAAIYCVRFTITNIWFPTMHLFCSVVVLELLPTDPGSASRPIILTSNHSALNSDTDLPSVIRYNFNASLLHGCYMSQDQNHLWRTSKSPVRQNHGSWYHWRHKMKQNFDSQRIICLAQDSAKQNQCWYSICLQLS